MVIDKNLITNICAATASISAILGSAGVLDAKTVQTVLGVSGGIAYYIVDNSKIPNNPNNK